MDDNNTNIEAESSYVKVTLRPGIPVPIIQKNPIMIQITNSDAALDATVTLEFVGAVSMQLLSECTLGVGSSAPSIDGTTKVNCTIKKSDNASFLVVHYDAANFTVNLTNTTSGTSANENVQYETSALAYLTNLYAVKY